MDINPTNKPPTAWLVTAFPNDQPGRANIAHNPNEVFMLLRMTPKDGHYTIQPLYGQLVEVADL